MSKTQALRRLNPNHTRAIQMMLAGMNNMEIGAAVGVHNTTVATWKSDPLFAQELRVQREEWEANIRDELLASPRYRIQVRSKHYQRLEGLIDRLLQGEDPTDVIPAIREVRGLLDDARKDLEAFDARMARLTGDQGPRTPVDAEFSEGSSEANPEDERSQYRQFAEHVRVMAGELGLWSEGGEVQQLYEGIMGYAGEGDDGV